MSASFWSDPVGSVSSIWSSEPAQVAQPALASPELGHDDLEGSSSLLGYFEEPAHVAIDRFNLPEAVHQRIKMNAELERQQREAQRHEADVQAELARDPQAANDPEARRRAEEYLDAKKDLGGLFEIAPDGSKAEGKAENQLTEAEFRDMAKVYADIKAGRGDIEVAGPEGATDLGKKEFKDKALRDVARIMQTSSGRDLIKELNDNPGKTKGDAHHKTVIRDGGGFQAGTSNDAQDPHIKYNPGQLFDDAKAESGKDSFAHHFRSDVTLYHELVHAHNLTHALKRDPKTGLWSGGVAGGGVSEKEAASGLDVGLSREEYQTAGLGKGADKRRFTENRYRAERNGVTESGRYNDIQLSDADKAMYPDWESWMVDGKMKPRPQYNAYHPPQ